MPLSPEDRTALLALLPELGPSGDRTRFVDAARQLGPAAVEEIREVPGMDQLRAGLLRVLPDLVPDDDAQAELRTAAAEALAIFPAMVLEEDPMLTLARHPAWVGLASLELGALGEGADRDHAVALARAGFQGGGGAEAGEVLWAMAEQAEEAGWTSRSAELLEAALTAPFDNEVLRGDVRLLLALRRAEDGSPGADRLLEQVFESSGPIRRRVHAAWVLAAMTRAEEPQRAIGLLSEAHSLLSGAGGDDSSVLRRIEEALASLGAPVRSDA